MVKNKADIQKAKRKAKKKEQRQVGQARLLWQKADGLIDRARFLHSQGELQEALTCYRGALKAAPRNHFILRAIAQISLETGRSKEAFAALTDLEDREKLPDHLRLPYGQLLADRGRFEEALGEVRCFLQRLSRMAIANKKAMRAAAKHLEQLCAAKLASPVQGPPPAPPPTAVSPERQPEPPPPPKVTYGPDGRRPAPLPPIGVELAIDRDAFVQALVHNRAGNPALLALALEGYRLRFREAFENLICLPTLNGVRSLWYQEETAKKALKTMRGRVMLADEVGLGKTIEAGIVLKEYVLRGMVKTALILAPPSLVSQWQEELAAKFDLHLPSTDDPQWRKDPAGLWDQPMIVASINQAKSKRHMDRVAQRPFDIVIVDEAHHLKNPKTLNWQLVNNLHKRFLLLLTATPVENNLMELYSLVTLLKPGQLSTASAFRQQFMTRGDPTSPQNRDKLKELLGQVMIRNTRALAKLDIPPRFAQTLRVTPAPAENAIYAQLTQVVKTLAQAQRHTDRLVIKTLLEQVGSSPAALVATLDRLSKREDLDPAVRGQIEAIGRLQRSMGDTGKDRQLIEILQAADGKMLIFAKFRATVDHLARLLEWHRIDHALFHGGMDGPEKDRQVERFREDKPVLIATEVGGEGRNLQFCHQMINFDLPWNPMRIEQRIGRLHRIGQNRPVQIYNLVSAGSVEDFILEVLDRKINMFEMVIGEIEMILGRVEGDQEFADLVLDIWLTAASESERRQRFDQLGKYLIKLKKEYEKTRVLDEKLFGDQYEL